MCGLLFYVSHEPVLQDVFQKALNKQSWRGPDAQAIEVLHGGKFALGHVRLSILETSNSADQPMISKCGRYKIIFNGEIYNHIKLREKFSLNCTTGSDTETLLEGFIKQGTEFFKHLDGMFSFVIFDSYTLDWFAARDRFGIKPLYQYHDGDTFLLSSETVSIRAVFQCSLDEDSISEWKLIRRPLPGYTFFKEIEEVLPGSIIKNGLLIDFIGIGDLFKESYSQTHIESLLVDSIKFQNISNVENVALLSGGLDSSIISKLSSTNRLYTIGLQTNNESKEAKEIAQHLQKDLKCVEMTSEDLLGAWETLIKLRGEPLSLPNEGLIYSICKKMTKNEKVVLTGEGADEIFFGYDRIFRCAVKNTFQSGLDFLNMYSYNTKTVATNRLQKFIHNLWMGKSNIEFAEDFFYKIHLPALLRRMDSATSAASKEARVPFLSNEIVNYMYRRSPDVKISDVESKIPLRRFAEKLNLRGPLSTPKVGFSSSFTKGENRYAEYDFFHKFNLEVLKW